MKKNKANEGKQTKEAERKNPPAGTSGENLNLDQAITLLNTSRPTFYRWLRTGKIQGMKVGRQWRFKREEIERFLRGEEPRIELRADIRPLVDQLLKQLKPVDEKFKQTEDWVEKELKTEDGQVNVAAALMISLGVKKHADSIHLARHIQEQGDQKIAILRYRNDGALWVSAEFDLRLIPPILSRWKTMSNCDLQEEKPQNGRISVRSGGEEFKLLTSFVRTALGESLTVRILRVSSSLDLLSIDRLGYSPSDKAKLLRGLQLPWGMIVVTGPSGSGRTSTLFACLKQLSGPERTIVTIEDPVEVILPWITQIKIQPDKGLALPSALRAAFRADPNILMVNECRDLETLSSIQNFALSGHLVFSTVFAEESVRALQEMVEIGSDPFLVGKTMKWILAQRLARKLCPLCSVEEKLSQELSQKAEELANAGGVEWKGLSKKFKKPVGCSQCGKTGFLGKTVMAEVLEVTPEITKILTTGGSAEDLRAMAVKQGMTTMTADGIRKAALGETTLEEVFRVSPLK